MGTFSEDPFIIEIPVNAVLNYLQEQSDPHDYRTHPGRLLCGGHRSWTDWHRLIRSGLSVPLHLNLGIPGIEIPDHPIEENPEALYAAIVLLLPTVPVLLSGEIELASESGLISEQAMSNLRNLIRVSI